MMKLLLGIVAIGALIGLANIVPGIKNSGEDIVVYVEAGKVSVKSAEQEAYKEIIEKKLAVKSGSYVKTDKTGMAHVVFPDNSVASLGNSAEMKLAYASAGISITQLLGDTYHRVAKLAQGKSYEVRTPGTLAAVRGTKFAVSYNASAKKAKVAVTESSVAVSRENATNTEPAKVGVGSLATVDENLPVTAKKAVSISLTKTDAVIKGWLDRNALIDQYLGDDPSKFLESFVNTSGDSNNLKNLRDRLEKTKASLSMVRTESKTGSLKSLLALGVAQKCTYAVTESGITSNATIYLAKDMMRVDSETTTNGKKEASHMILASKTMYVWGDGMPQGVKMAVPDGSAASAQETGGNVQFIDLDKEVSYSCGAWSADASYFAPPKNITFTDMSQVLNQAAPSGSTGGTPDLQAMQCGACDTLQEPDRSECRRALSCR